MIKTFYYNRHFDDFEILGEVVRAWQIDFSQLDKGLTDCDLFQIVSERLILGSMSSNRTIRHVGTPPLTMWTFTLLSPASPPWVWGGREISSETIIVYQPGTGFDCVSMPGYVVFTFSIAPEVLDRLCSDLELPYLANELMNQKLVKCSQSKTSDLWQKVINHSQVFTHISNEQRETDVWHDQEDRLLKYLLIALAEGTSITRKKKDEKISRIINRIDEYLEANPFTPMTVGELCKITQVSDRTLQYNFRSLLGLTPKEYLKAINLNRVKKELYESNGEDIRISDIANKWGFWHMGQFAANYRQHFGELPSETLKSRK